MDDACTILRLGDAPWQGAAARAWLHRLPAACAAASGAAVLHDGRNRIVRLAGPAGCAVAVKRFPLRPWQRRLEPLRPHKAVRAFDQATWLLAHGLGTPAPYAVIATPAHRYLVTACADGCRQAWALHDTALPGRATLLAALGGFLARLHDAGALHRDLTPGNVLIDAADGFLLVDINRLRRTEVDAARGAAELVQLGLADADPLADAYAAARGLDRLALRQRLRALAWWHRARWWLKDGTRPLRRRLAGRA